MLMLSFLNLNQQELKERTRKKIALYRFSFHFSVFLTLNRKFISACIRFSSKSSIFFFNRTNFGFTISSIDLEFDLISNREWGYIDGKTYGEFVITTACIGSITDTEWSTNNHDEIFIRIFHSILWTGQRTSRWFNSIHSNNHSIVSTLVICVQWSFLEDIQQ